MAKSVYYLVRYLTEDIILLECKCQQTEEVNTEANLGRALKHTVRMNGGSVMHAYSTCGHSFESCH